MGNKDNKFLVESEEFFYGRVTYNLDNLTMITEMGVKLVIRGISPSKIFKLKNSGKYDGLCGVMVSLRKDIDGNIDMGSLRFKNMLVYNRVYDEHYIERCRKRAEAGWIKEISSEEFIKLIRGRD